MSFTQESKELERRRLISQLPKPIFQSATSAKQRALSQLPSLCRVVTYNVLGNQIAFVVVRDVEGKIVRASDHWFTVSKWRWNDSSRQFNAACKLCSELNDVLLENAPVDGSAGMERLLADIREGEEFADKALARRDSSGFHSHTAYVDLCRRRLAKMTSFS